MTSALSARERETLRLLSEGEGYSVSDISGLLKVSAVTVRSDLNRLAEKGFVVRTRGGALPAFHPGILERQRQHTDEKNHIARAAADLVRDGDHIMISAGTTTALIARYLLGKRDVRVVTNSTLLLPYARVNPGLHVTLVGGEFRPSAEAVVGPIALEDLERFHVRVAFFGADGISVDRGITADQVEVAEIVKKMAAQARERVVAADSSKFGKAGFAHILPMDQIDTIVTDDALTENIRQQLAELNITLRTK